MTELRFVCHRGAVALDVDDEHGQIYIYLDGEQAKPGSVKNTKVLTPKVNLDFDEFGYLIGIEIV